MRLSSLAGKRGYRLAMILAVILSFCALGFGFFADDYLFIATLEGQNPLGHTSDLYVFGSGNAEEMKPLIQKGPYPWFGDSDFKVHFFRPLSSLLMSLDHSVFGHNALGYNFHSALWYIGLCLTAMLLYRKILPPAIGVLALFLFVVDESHVIPAVWWSNRHSIIAVSMGFLGVFAHLRWREDNWNAGLPLSLLAFVVSLLAAETGLCVLAYVLAYEVFGRRDDTIKHRFISVLPAALLSVGYLLLYRAGSYGAQFSDIYIDPMGDPITFLMAAPGRLMMLLGAQFFMLPVEASILKSDLEPLLIIAGSVDLGILAFIIYKLWPCFKDTEKQALYWLIPGAVLATTPSLASIVNSRVLLAASLGGSAILAVIIACLWRETAALRKKSARPVVRIVMSVLMWLFIIGHLGIATLSWPGQVVGLRFVMNGLNTIIRTSELDENGIADSQVVVFNPPDPYTGLYQLMLRSFDGNPLPRSWWTLSFSPFGHRITRTGEKEMELEVVDGEMLTSIMERLFRSQKRPLHEGYEVDLDGLQVVVLEMGTKGPVRIALIFEEPPESDRYQLLVFREGKYRRLDIPAIGESVDLPHGFL